MLFKRITPLYLFIVVLWFAGCAPESPAPGNSIDPEIARLQARAEGITIMRDDFGVPHIYGKTDADAVFGMLYAQAEDDFPRIEQNYIWATGRLAEVEGEEAIYSDLRARLYMTIDEARAAYEAAPQWLKDLCDAYADGLNWYLHTHPDVEPVATDYAPRRVQYIGMAYVTFRIKRPLHTQRTTVPTTRNHSARIKRAKF